MDLQLEAIWRFLSFLCSSFHQPWQVVIVGSFAYVLGRSQSEKLQKLQAQVRFFFHVLWMFTILPLLLSIGLFTIASTFILEECLLWLKWVGEFSIIFINFSYSRQIQKSQIAPIQSLKNISGSGCEAPTAASYHGGADMSGSSFIGSCKNCNAWPMLWTLNTPVFRILEVTKAGGEWLESCVLMLFELGVCSSKWVSPVFHSHHSPLFTPLFRIVHSKDVQKGTWFWKIGNTFRQLEVSGCWQIHQFYRQNWHISQCCVCFVCGIDFTCQYWNYQLLRYLK